MRPKYFYCGNQGFTLIEILITIALTGILAAVAAPSFVSWLENKKIDDVAASVEGAIKEAQSTSIRRNQTCTLNITSRTVSATPANCLPTGTRTISATVTNWWNIAIDVTNNTVKFTSKGTTLDTEPFVISRINNGTNDGTMKCVVISSGLGVVRSGIYNDNDPPSIPASLGDAPLQDNPPTAAQAEAKLAWDTASAARSVTVNTVVNKCISPAS
jgi:prepilin-type N-terminal cleavage/methylation domain-containing protein